MYLAGRDMSAAFSDNPYLAPTATDIAVVEFDPDTRPGFFPELVIAFVAFGTGVLTWWVSVLAFILGGAVAEEPFFTIAVCLAIFFPCLFAVLAARGVRKLLRAAYSKLFLNR